ncbi:MAG TPA: serine hydrolase [Candidatus Margulisiibacteriota bacterium]|nr:serine hydrolase [Candidatus Margulisiibacteriota bacterium]
MIRSAALLAMLFLPLLSTTGSAEGAPSSAAAYLLTIRPSRELQQFLDQSVAALAASDSSLHHADVRIALLDLSGDGPPRLAQRRGALPIYPASVVKFIYLMAAYAWQENGLGRIDGEMDKLLTSMVHDSSNQATRQVFARLTATEPGPELSPDEYAVFRQRRLAVDRWLATVGITDLHCANPTYDGDGDLYGRDKQFLSDPQIAGGLPAHNGDFANRNAMTAVGTAKLLALLATDRALSPESSAIVRQRMRRDVVQQPHLAHRLAGGAARLPDLEVYSKSGTWGPIYADAGIIHHVSGRQLVLVVFTQAQPPYRGDFIADLAQRVAEHVLSPKSVRK